MGNKLREAGITSNGEEKLYQCKNREAASPAHGSAGKQCSCTIRIPVITRTRQKEVSGKKAAFDGISGLICPVTRHFYPAFQK